VTESSPSIEGIADASMIVAPDLDAEIVRLVTGGTGVIGLLGVRVHELTRDRVVISLAVGPMAHQPSGLLHGGVSALLAETAASFGASIAAPPGFFAVGIELNASHLRSMVEGTLTAVATPARKGRTIHVWDIALTDEDGRAICDARCTLAIRPRTEPASGSAAPDA
jgi:1,4-dihydroxy-2-naphthoyl-CoA hydrolase